jgi:predicted metal-dependent peptidase
MINGYEQCPLTAQGGGGTDFRPVFDRAAQLISEGQSVAGVVYLTDLYGPMPDECDIPTLWLSTTSRVAKFGRTVPIES